jgi:hypothetical protein
LREKFIRMLENASDDMVKEIYEGVFYNPEFGKGTGFPEGEKPIE